MTAVPTVARGLDADRPDHAGDSGSAPPQVRLLDTVATGSLDAGLSATSARLIEFTLDELDRFTRALGDAGLVALIAYLRVLRRERDDNGRDLLVLDEFSGSWLHRSTDLGRNAAFKAQGRLVDLGVFRTLKAQAGVGARGRQRAVLNPGLVAIPGIHDTDLSARTRRTRSGRPSVPVSAKPGIRETGSTSRIPEIRETGPETHPSGIWETGNPPIESPQPTAGFPPDQPPSSPGTTSSEGFTGIGIPLLSGEGQVGIVLRTLRPALTHDAEHAHQVLHRALNASCVMARVEEVAAALRVPGRSTQVLDTILDHFAGLLADPAAIRDVLRRHAVNDTVHRRYTDDQAVERYILGLVTALGYTKSISSFGAWLYSAYRSTWTPRVNDALKAFLAACDTLGALEARRAHHLHAENTPIAHRVVRVFDELPPDFRGAPRSGTSDGPTTIDELSPSAVPGPGPTARTGPDRPDPPRQRPAPPRGDPPPDAAIGLATSAVSDDPDASAPTHTDPAPADTRTAATTTGTSPAPTPGGPTARARPPTRGLRRPAPAAPSDDLVAAHLGAAVAALPHLSRHGPMDNADFRRQLVRVYLARQPVVPAPGTDEIDPSDEHGPTSQRSSHPDVIAASSA